MGCARDYLLSHAWQVLAPGTKRQCFKEAAEGCVRLARPPDAACSLRTEQDALSGLDILRETLVLCARFHHASPSSFVCNPDWRFTSTLHRMLDPEINAWLEEESESDESYHEGSDRQRAHEAVVSHSRRRHPV
eukprot:6187953-Pleurochrysis_carterae.AAC.1